MMYVCQNKHVEVTVGLILPPLCGFQRLHLDCSANALIHWATLPALILFLWDMLSLCSQASLELTMYISGWPQTQQASTYLSLLSADITNVSHHVISITIWMEAHGPHNQNKIKDTRSLSERLLRTPLQLDVVRWLHSEVLYETSMFCS